MARGIDYGGMMHRAMQRLIAEVLEQIAAEGLPGEHHFFITFDTRDPDVEMADWLRERYPEEMTIVIQHRYWDLAIDDEGFQIGLSFNQVPAKLRIPFDAVTGFVDPAVDFTLQFPMKEGEVAPEPEPAPPIVQGEPGSNVVTMDAFRKK